MTISAFETQTMTATTTVSIRLIGDWGILEKVTVRVNLDQKATFNYLYELITNSSVRYREFNLDTPELQIDVWNLDRRLFNSIKRTARRAA